ncbi:hypothetical protein HFO56_23915 [Rhizobium laguerreae]|nr:hypothetical protein [Rhizobium laguerreae]
MLKSLPETAAEEMCAVSACLQELFRKTRGFLKTSVGDFEEGLAKDLLMAGKRLECRGSPKANRKAWHGSPLAYEHSIAAGTVVTGKLRKQAAKIVGYVFDATSGLTELTVDWVTGHPFALPVFASATGTTSKKFRNERNIGNSSDRRIGKTDAARIVATLRSGKILAKREVMAGMESAIEGIVRDRIGKVINEDFVRRALDEAGIPYLRDAPGADAIEGILGASRADFAIPAAAAPKAFIEVRKSGMNHASMFANDLSMTVIDRISRHPECVSILLFDGAWSGPAKEKLERAFDHVFHVLESDSAAATIKRHLAGEDMRKAGRLYLTSR